MIVCDLHISNFRNIREAKLKLSKGLNVFTGSNAAGKTSILEALYFLGRGRSFRTNRFKDLIKKETERSTLYSEFYESGGKRLSIGVTESHQQLEIFHDGKKVERTSELATLLPLVFAGPDAGHQLFINPGERRRLLDWGVFHVEHWGRVHIEKYRRQLAQRNSLLKSQSNFSVIRKQIQCWDDELANSAHQIDLARLGFLSQFNPVFKLYLNELSPGIFVQTEVENTVTLRYTRGWPKENSLSDVLSTDLDLDIQRGATSRGPHRADLQPYLGLHPAVTWCSHGQQKLITAAMTLAQVFLLKQNQNQPGLLLFDDLPSELDKDHQQRFLSLLSKLGTQACITATELDLINHSEFINSGEDYPKMFHVEHGVITANKIL